jgi:mitogen-activated protein kinase kinase kinase
MPYVDILIDHQGQLKLTDFGASKIIAQGQKTLGLATVKVANSLTGTPMYMVRKGIDDSSGFANIHT